MLSDLYVFGRRGRRDVRGLGRDGEAKEQSAASERPVLLNKDRTTEEVMERVVRDFSRS